MTTIPKEAAEAARLVVMLQYGEVHCGPIATKTLHEFADAALSAALPHLVKPVDAERHERAIEVVAAKLRSPSTFPGETATKVAVELIDAYHYALGAGTVVQAAVAYRWRWKDHFNDYWVTSNKLPAFDPSKIIEPLYAAPPPPAAVQEPVAVKALDTIAASLQRHIERAEDEFGECSYLNWIKRDLSDIRALSTFQSDPAPEIAALPQDVINLVIAAREAFDTGWLEDPESSALDKALEVFSSRVPYENEPDDVASTAPEIEPEEIQHENNLMNENDALRAENERLRKIKDAANVYVASVNGGPGPLASDAVWKAYDNAKQAAFDVLAVVVAPEQGEV
jgi:hypothetical protein